MSEMWNRTLVYLGLKEEPEEGYEASEPGRFDAEDDPHAEHAPPRGGSVDRLEDADGRADDDEPSTEATRSVDRASRRERRETARAVAPPPMGDTNVRPLRSGDVHVRAVPAGPATRAAVIRVDTFDDVEAVGARYRTGQPVLFDVTGADRPTGRRVVDFVSGLTYALRGRLTKVGTWAFLLLPDGVELPAEERRRLTDLGYRLPDGSDA